MIFGVLELEKVIQIDDRTRLDASKSYTTPDEGDITLIEIQPEGTESLLMLRQVDTLIGSTLGLLVLQL